MPTIRDQNRVSPWVRVGLACLILGFAFACQRAPRPSGPPPIQLVETIPIETQLGNPELPAALDVWLEMIDGAQRSLDFEEFYLSHWPGEPLGQVLDAIGSAAERGVKVRILLDARMYRTYPKPADSLALVPGIAVRRIDMGPYGGGVQHAKYFLVDGREMFVGSQNLDWRALKHIHELGVRIRDPRVTAAFRQVFEMDWAAADPNGEEQPPEPGHASPLPIVIVQAPNDTARVWPSYSPRNFIPDSTRWDRDAVIDLLDRARSQVVVQLLSYHKSDRGVVDDALHEAIRRAGGRGVQVRILVSDWQADSDRIESLEDLAQNPNIEARMSVVQEWSGGYIPFARVEHCKFMVVDSLTTWLGTSNWAPSYFHTSRNIAVTIENQPLALEVLKTFETSWSTPGGVDIKSGAPYTPRIHGVDPPPGQTAYGN